MFVSGNKNISEVHVHIIRNLILFGSEKLTPRYALHKKAGF